MEDPGLDLDRAIHLLSTVADYNVSWAVAASIDLAKLLEHRKREPEAALHYARRAMALLRDLPVNSMTRLKPEVSHRIGRLERKVALRSGISANGALPADGALKSPHPNPLPRGEG
jgi:hypothetical protein